MTRGTGAINGTGIINGTGATNGTGLSLPRGAKSGSRVSGVRKWQFLAILVAILIVVPTFILLSNNAPSGLAIDGKFGDWSKADMFGMRNPASGAGIAVQEWSVQNEGNSLYAYISVEGTLMSTSNVDSFYAFVDTDDDPDTGYSVSDLGAEYMLVLDGWENQVRTASMMRYGSTSDLMDWNSWTEAGALAYSLNAGKIEARADLPFSLGSDARYLLLTQTNNPDQDCSVSYPVPETGGLLIARLQPGNSIDPDFGTVPAEPGVVFAELSLSCEGSDGRVSAILPTVAGASLVSSFGEVSLSPGENKTYDIELDASSCSASDAVSVLLDGNSFESTFGDIMILQDSVRAYAVSAPASIEIDGAFGDWLSRLTPDNDSSTVANPNINMTSTGYAGAADFASFYVSVEGEMFKGVYAPSAKAKPAGGGGGGAVIPQRKSGEDVLRIFIDSDLSDTTGLAVTRSGKTIGADYLIDIRGNDGIVVSGTLSAYSGSSWSLEPGTLAMAKDLQRLELSVAVASIGGSSVIATIIETTDWKDRSDWAWAAAVPDPWVINGPGATYQSDTGALWGYIGAPTLEPGDHIVDLILNMGGTEIYILTNTGRTFYISIASPGVWVAGVTTPIDTAVYSQAVSFTFYSTRAGYLLTSNGTYFWCQDLGASNKHWTVYPTKIEEGVNDFKDIVYTKTGNTVYALHSTANTRLDCSLNGGSSFTSQTSQTGANSTHTDLVVIGAPANTSDRLYVLCENGVIRYSSTGGSTWGALGNLPYVFGGNTSKYVGMGIDSTGYMWVVTDTGYCYRSTDTTFASFNYTGQAPIGGIVAIAPLPTVPGIPEFTSALVPLLGMAALVMVGRLISKRKESA